MRILHIHNHLGQVGGAEVYFSEVCQGLQARGHEIVQIYLVPQGVGGVLESESYQLEKPHGYLNGLLNRGQFLKILRRESPDVIHLHGLFSPVWVKALLDRYPVVLTLHNVAPLCFWTSKVRSDTGEFCQTRMGWHCVTSRCYTPWDHGGWVFGTYRSLVSLQYLHLLLRLPRIIAPSQAIERELLAVGVPADRITRVPHFTRIQDNTPTSLVPSRSILFAGRLSWEKGIREFIDMLALLHVSGWMAIIVGDGPLMEDAQLRTRDRNVQERVRFIGQVSHSEIGAYFRAAQVVVVPSTIPEAFGLVGIEAMAYGRPVVAFDAGGVREWLHDGMTGFVVPQGNLQAMATRVDQLLDDPVLAATMGQAGKKQAESKFGRETHLDRLLDAYQQATTHDL